MSTQINPQAACSSFPWNCIRWLFTWER